MLGYLGWVNWKINIKTSKIVIRYIFIFFKFSFTFFVFCFLNNKHIDKGTIYTSTWTSVSSKCCKKIKFSITDFLSECDQTEGNYGTEEILHWKHFFGVVKDYLQNSYCIQLKHLYPNKFNLWGPGLYGVLAFYGPSFWGSGFRGSVFGILVFGVFAFGVVIPGS